MKLRLVSLFMLISVCSSGALAYVDGLVLRSTGIEILSCQFEPAQGTKHKAFQSKKFDVCLGRYVYLNTHNQEDAVGDLKLKLHLVGKTTVHEARLFWRPIQLPEYRWWDFLNFSSLLAKAAYRGFVLSKIYADHFVSIEFERAVPVSDLIRDKVVLGFLKAAMGNSKPTFDKIVLTSKRDAEGLLKATLFLYNGDELVPAAWVQAESTWKPFSKESDFTVEVNPQ